MFLKYLYIYNLKQILKEVGVGVRDVGWWGWGLRGEGRGED